MKISCLVISFIISLMFFSCNWDKEKERQSLEEISKQELASALNERDQLLVLVKEVASGLKQIRDLENIMSVSATHPEKKAVARDQILSDIAYLKDTIQRRKKQLQELEKRLNNSAIDNRELQGTIDVLRDQIDSQINEIESLRQRLIAANTHIGILSNEVDSLNSSVIKVIEERNAARETSVRLSNELNTCYYIIATKSELKTYNIIETGFLRKTKLMKDSFDKGRFIRSDKRFLNILPLNASKARILTNHPQTSYIVFEENGKKYVKITDPDKFWSLTNYLVIQKN